ncbi:MAG: hypothetical protein KKI15_05070 [Proteobacteria bacterium]|nr:hypothetical protein [Pseudomonadota bacterium]
MTVYFHGSFGLNRERMAGILRLGLKNSDFRDQKLAEPFGYNSPFTARYRSDHGNQHPTQSVLIAIKMVVDATYIAPLLLTLHGSTLILTHIHRLSKPL